MYIIKSIALGLLGVSLIMPNAVLANGDRQIQHSYSNTNLGYGFELDNRETIYENNATGNIYLDSQTHVQTSTSENTYIYGGSNSRDYLNTNQGDRSTYEFGVKYEF